MDTCLLISPLKPFWNGPQLPRSGEAGVRHVYMNINVYIYLFIYRYGYVEREKEREKQELAF